MPKLALVYGMRLLPADELESLHDAPIQLKDGKGASVTMHLIEGQTEKDVRRQLEQSIDAFFRILPRSVDEQMDLSLVLVELRSELESIEDAIVSLEKLAEVRRRRMGKQVSGTSDAPPSKPGPKTKRVTGERPPKVSKN